MAGCRRDADSGLWFSKAGDILAADPVTAPKVLRRELIATAVRKHQVEGRNFTR